MIRGYASSGLMRWVIVATVTVVIWIAWSSTHTPEALWAPGHLHRVHAEVKTCTQCHEPFQGPTFDKCVDCHTPQQFKQSGKQTVGLFHVGVITKKQSCFECHVEHKGETAVITLGGLENPHGDFIFQATRARVCTDCHAYPQGHQAPPTVLNNTLVRHLIEEGEGAHRKGKFANCLKCHGGGLFDDD